MGTHVRIKDFKITVYDIFEFILAYGEKWELKFIFCFLLFLYRDPVLAPFIAIAAAKSLQSCMTLCNPIDSNPPGSTIPEILQARILEWVAISFSNSRK